MSRRRRARGRGTGRGGRGEPLGSLGAQGGAQRRRLDRAGRPTVVAAQRGGVLVREWPREEASELCESKAKLLGWLGGAEQYWSDGSSA